MISFLIFASLCSLLSGAVVGLVFLLLGTSFFLSSFNIDLNIINFLVLALTIISFPIAAFIAGYFCDQFINLGITAKKTISSLSIVAALYFILEAGIYWQTLDSSLALIQAQELQNYMTWFLSLTANVVLTASTVAIILISLILLIELPVHWIQNAASLPIKFNFGVFRIILMLFFISISSHLIIDYFLLSFS